MMKTTLSTLTMTLLLTAPVFCQDAKLSKTSAATAISAYKLDIKKAEADYQRAITEARTIYIEKLKDALDKETKRGAVGLDDALLIRAEIKWVESEKTGTASGRLTIVQNLAETTWLSTRTDRPTVQTKVQYVLQGKTLYQVIGKRELLCVPVDDTRLIVFASNTLTDTIHFDQKHRTYAAYNQAFSRDRPFANAKRIK